MKNTIELAAEFIRRAAFVDANALLRDRIRMRGLVAILRDYTGSIQVVDACDLR
jgi:hypothetical protein